MIETLLFFTHYILLLIFGIILTFCLAGIQLSHKKNIRILSACFVFCGLFQLITFTFFNELLVWKLYPLITHCPLIFVLCFYYRKHIATALTAVSSAYLCCQPSKWFGLLCRAITDSYVLEQLTRIAVLLLVGIIVIFSLAPYLSKLFNKDIRNVLIFGSVPIVYYIFDYWMGIYTNFWFSHYQVVAEFLPFFLCVVYMLFCFVYYKEYELKSDAKQKEKIVGIILQQKEKEIESIKTREQELRLLRHDMRLILNNLAICIEQNAPEKALEIISSYSSYIEGTKVKRFCFDDTVNYILSDFAAKCDAKHISFTHIIELEELKFDKILFSSILSNILDNAINAQMSLSEEKRIIKVMLKSSEGKTLLSVKNAIEKIPTFVDGLPISSKEGHGYGTQSILYMTTRLGGNCQFTVQNNMFVTRIVL